MANYNYRPQMHMLSDRRVYSLDNWHWSRCGHLTFDEQLTDDPSKVTCTNCVGTLTEAEKRKRTVADHATVGSEVERGTEY